MAHSFRLDSEPQWGGAVEVGAVEEARTERPPQEEVGGNRFPLIRQGKKDGGG